MHPPDPLPRKEPETITVQISVIGDEQHNYQAVMLKDTLNAARCSLDAIAAITMTNFQHQLKLMLEKELNPERIYG